MNPETFLQLSKNEKNKYIKNMIIKSTKIKFPKNETESNLYDYKFWPSQPLLNNENEMNESNFIYEKLDKVCIEKIDHLELSNLQLSNNTMANDILKLINENNGKDFNIIYNTEHLNLLLGSDNIIIGLKFKDKLIGVIFGSIKDYCLCDKNVKIGVVKFLYINKLYHGKRYSEYLINGFKNELIDKNIYYCLFTSNRYIPVPISKIDKYYRPLNYKKLCNTQFCTTKDKKIFSYNKEKYKLDQDISHLIVNINENNVDNIFNIYLEYMEKFYLYEHFSLNKLKEIIKNKHVSVYGLLNKDNIIVDFFMYFNAKARHNNIDISYADLLFYTNVSVEYTPNKILNIISKVAHDEKNDMLILNNNLESNNVLEEVDSYYSKLNMANYIYLYNWKTPKMNLNQIGYI